MDMQYPISDQLNLITAQIRLLAGLMLAGPDLQDVESDAFALMLQDLAVRLERMTKEYEQCIDCTYCRAREGRS